MTMTILVAPSGFKESLCVTDVTKSISDGILRAMPNAEILEAPMVDGGEGTTEALVRATGGTIIPTRVTGPAGDPVDSFFGFLGGPGPRTAVIEMAAAAGLSLVPRDQRNPMLTTSFGVGELILHALDAGAEQILVGCGDSGINDGGAGLAQALGARLLDEEGAEIGCGGAELMWLHRIDLSTLDPRLKTVQIDAAVNWHNMLLGPRGVARVFGPQKGATPDQVDYLDAALQRWATAIRAETGFDVGEAQGAGASGGLGAGLIAFAGATLHPRFDIVMNYLDFDRLLGKADLVITAEGSLDGQSPYGKVPCEVARRAAERSIPTVALAGTIGKGVDQTFDHGISAFASILKRPCTLEDAIRDGERLLRRAAEDAMRMLSVGLHISEKQSAA
ncbi:glycerate kinase [Ruegeria sp. HKCCD8929]|uniref:glycerate kinase family protein n=1 Tax=Ruegeria sp. HKCCD8929 TaxID=2683006 RepID=UPI0014897FA1|nr:glycerate kinase [Ruegeria sp. HKCCD8929]